MYIMFPSVNGPHVVLRGQFVSIINTLSGLRYRNVDSVSRK